MKLYNSMTRTKEELRTIVPGQVSIYACGPTVYNLMHVGNARQICVFDVLRRYLVYRGYSVTYAQNFTDIDDKIIQRANEEGTDYKTVSETFMAEYFTDARGLNVQDADLHPKATENMDQIIEIIGVLIDKGHAYATANGDVYFRTNSFPGYGKLSHQPLEELRSGARIAAGEDKEDPMDFAVWKAAKPGEPFWPSPFGNGRPGWHIECSAMVRSIFGGTIDIHGGGQDLIFPHHENEIAQSECCNGAPLARYWIHNGHLNVDNKKMSKSLGNFFTVREVAQRYGYGPIRYLMASAHYRSPMNYSEQSIAQAAASLERLTNCKERLVFQQAKSLHDSAPGDDAIYRGLLRYRDRFITAMDDDLNTADGVSHIFDLAREINVQVLTQASPSRTLCQQALQLFLELCGILGILADPAETQDLDAEIEALIAKRSQARKDKDWATADAIRDELAARNIVLEDTPDGIKWRFSKPL